METTTWIPHAYWMGPDQIAFTALGDERHGLYTEHDSEPGVFIYSGGVITRHDNAERLICAQGNRVFYWSSPFDQPDQNGAIIWTFGTIGSEERVTRTPDGALTKLGKKWSPPRGQAFNEFTCDYEKEPRLDHSRVSRFLRPEHGYLEFGVKGSGDVKHRGTFVRASDGVRLQTPFSLAYLRDIVYYPWVGKYLVWQSDDDAWWLSPDGTVDKIKIPAEPWLKWRIGQVRFTSRGYLLNAGQSSRGWFSTAGLYLTDLKGNRVQIVDGMVHDVEVSPDGCKVFYSEYQKAGNKLVFNKFAFEVRPADVVKPAIPRWKLIDLCRDVPEGLLIKG